MARVGISCRIHESYHQWWKEQATRYEVSEATYLEMLISRIAQEQGDELPANDRPGVTKVSRKE